MPPPARLLTFLTDYGLQDTYVGACHAVIAAAAPQVRIVDLTHAVPPGDVRWGAVLLADAVAAMPVPAVNLAVVDPEVGGPRRAIIVQAGEHLLVGPDNGLLWPAARALRGPDASWELPIPSGASATFHGRDVFAAAAAELAAGAAPESLGEDLAARDLTRLRLPAPDVGRGWLSAEVLTIDRFGTLQLAARGSDLAEARLDMGAAVTVSAAERPQMAGMIARTFADVAPRGLLVLIDSAGRVAVAVRDGSAAEALRAEARDVVHIGAADGPG